MVRIYRKFYINVGSNPAWTAIQLNNSQFKTKFKMNQFHIYHSIEVGKRFTETENQKRVYAGFVEANSIEEAYIKSQNGILVETWNILNPCRSTSVGDVIQDDLGFHMVCNMGFKKLDDAPEPTIPELHYPQ